MIHELVSVAFGNRKLRPFNFRVNKLNDLAAAHTHEMVMVRTLFELIERTVTVKMVTHEDIGRLKLLQNAVHRCQTDIFTHLHKLPVDVFGRKMTALTTFLRALLEKFKDAQARSSCFKTDTLEFSLFFRISRVSHVSGLIVGKRQQPVQTGCSASKRHIPSVSVRGRTSAGVSRRRENSNLHPGTTSQQRRREENPQHIFQILKTFSAIVNTHSQF